MRDFVSAALTRAAPWRQTFEAELLTFPAGKHDDQVDALGLVGQLLDKMVVGAPLRPPEPALRDGYARSLDEETEGQRSWMTV